MRRVRIEDCASVSDSGGGMSAGWTAGLILSVGDYCTIKQPIPIIRTLLINCIRWSTVYTAALNNRLIKCAVFGHASLQ